MNSHGIPTLKELFRGVMIDVSSSPNRHLAQANLEGRLLHLELIEVPADLEDDEDEEAGEGEEFEEDDGDENYDPMGLASTLGIEEDDGDEDDEGEQCLDYPSACPTCEDLECGHEADNPADSDLLDVELRVTLLWPALNVAPRILEDEELEENPALCRFLNQVKDHNDL